jgi:hypothetical protein
MDTPEVLDALLKYLLAWWFSQATGNGSSNEAKQPCSNTSSSCNPSLDRCSRKRGSIGMHASIHVSSKHFDVSPYGMMGNMASKNSLSPTVLTPAPVSCATKLFAARRYPFWTSKSDIIASEVGVVVPSTPSPVRIGHSSSVSYSSSSREQQAAGSGSSSGLPSCSTPGFMLPTASSKARSLGVFSKRSTCHISTVSTPAQVDRVHKVRS